MKTAAILAFVLASATAFAATPSIANSDHKTVLLPADTDIHLQLAETISSHTAKAGEIVRFRTVGDTTINGVLVIPDGTAAEGIVIDAKPKGHLGRAGHLDIGIKFLRMGHGVRVPLDGDSDQDGQGHGTRTGVAVGAASALFLPAAPFFLLMHGADVVLTEGTPVTAFVDHDTPVPLPAD
jgi:hypothetical protein